MNIAPSVLARINEILAAGGGGISGGCLDRPDNYRLVHVRKGAPSKVVTTTDGVTWTNVSDATLFEANGRVLTVGQIYTSQHLGGSVYATWCCQGGTNGTNGCWPDGMPDRLYASLDPDGTSCECLRQTVPMDRIAGTNTWVTVGGVAACGGGSFTVEIYCIDFGDGPVRRINFSGCLPTETLGHTITVTSDSPFMATASATTTGLFCPDCPGGVNVNITITE